MNLEGILNISGETGLFKVVATTTNTIIVESLTDGKRKPISSHSKVNMLEEISLYTYSETKPLTEIFEDIAKQENGKKAISHKSQKNDLTNYFREILPEYDEERVYISDIKKVIQWYNSLHSFYLIETK